MSKFISMIAAVFFLTAFFVSPSLATDVCPDDNKEQVLTSALQTNPEYLIVVLEGDTLQGFWNKLLQRQLLLGVINADKIYVIKSERHEDAVYLFFLKDGCITDVKMTSKSLILELVGKS